MGEGGYLDVQSSTFKGKFGTLKCPSGYLMLPFNTYFFTEILFRLCIVLSMLFMSDS